LLDVDLSENIQIARKIAKLTQLQLAEKLGLSVMTIRRYESGNREPKFDMLEKIASVLNQPVEALLGIGHFEIEIGDLEGFEDAKSSNKNTLKERPHRSYDGTVRIKADDSMGLDLERAKELATLIENETDEIKLAEYMAEFEKYKEFFIGFKEQLSNLSRAIIDTAPDTSLRTAKEIITKIGKAFGELSPDNQKAALSYINYLKEQESKEDISDE